MVTTNNELTIWNTLPFHSDSNCLSHQCQLPFSLMPAGFLSDSSCLSHRCQLPFSLMPAGFLSDSSCLSHRCQLPFSLMPAGFLSDSSCLLCCQVLSRAMAYMESTKFCPFSYIFI